MKPLRPLVIVALATLVLGCKVPKQDVELLERDLRIQEDEIYALRDCVDTYQQKLESSRSENRALRQELAARGGTGARSAEEPAPPATTVGPEVDLGPVERFPATDETYTPPPQDLQEAPPFSRPQVAPPDAAVPGEAPLQEALPEGTRLERIPLDGTAPDELQPAGDPALQGASAEDESGVRLAQHVAGGAPQLLQRLRGAAQEPPITDPVRDLEVTEITLSKPLTGGMNRDQRNGDEGIMVVVEPRNPKNQIVEAFGDVSIVLLDPALEGEEARVARWDITAQELEHRFRRRQLGRGFQLMLPWPGDPPEHSDLHLFVRYVAADGRKLIIDRPLTIEPPGGAKEGGWVPVARSDGPTEVRGPSLMAPAETIESGDQAPETMAASAARSRDPRRTWTTVPLERSAAAPSAPPSATLPASATSQTADVPRGESTVGSQQPTAPSVAEQAPAAESSAPAKKQRPRWKPYR